MVNTWCNSSGRLPLSTPTNVSVSTSDRNKGKKSTSFTARLPNSLKGFTFLVHFMFQFWPIKLWTLQFTHYMTGHIIREWFRMCLTSVHDTDRTSSTIDDQNLISFFLFPFSVLCKFPNQKGCFLFTSLLFLWQVRTLRMRSQNRSEGSLGPDSTTTSYTLSDLTGWTYTLCGPTSTCYTPSGKSHVLV